MAGPLVSFFGAETGGAVGTTGAADVGSLFLATAGDCEGDGDGDANASGVGGVGD